MLESVVKREPWTAAIGQTLEPATQAEVLESVGRRCAQEYAGGLYGQVTGRSAEVTVERALLTVPSPGINPPPLRLGQ